MRHRKNKSSIQRSLCIVFLSCILAISSSSSSFASTGQNVTFAWQANPAHENIMGYRLYHGKSSRFLSGGVLKSGFDYDYYIDFNERMLCSGDDFSNCRYLGIEEMSCEGLYQSVPKCTVDNASNSEYFTLTAYNDYGESSFTQELQLIGAKLMATLNAINHLLLREKN